MAGKKEQLTQAGKPVKHANKLGKTGPKGNSKAKVKRVGDAKYGARIRKARKAKGWSQAALAKKAGVTQPSVSNIENGTVVAGPNMKAALAKALR